MQHQDFAHSSRSKSSKTERKDGQQNVNKIDWNSIYAEMQKCRNYEELEVLVDSLDESRFEDLYHSIRNAGPDAVIGCVAVYHYPTDGPKNLTPIETDTDGNCFCQAVRRSIFGTEEEYNMLRMRIVIECIKNKQLYFDNDYLMNGATYIHTKCTFPWQYALFSGLNIPLSGTGNLDDWVDVVYNAEMMAIQKDGHFMGMWQLWVTSNIIGRPVRTVFPHQGSIRLRSDFNRMLYPQDVNLRNLQPLDIMWTPVTYTGEIDHFIPLLKKN